MEFVNRSDKLLVEWSESRWLPWRSDRDGVELMSDIAGEPLSVNSDND